MNGIFGGWRAHEARPQHLHIDEQQTSVTMSMTIQNTYMLLVHLRRHPQPYSHSVRFLSFRKVFDLIFRSALNMHHENALPYLWINFNVSCVRHWIWLATRRIRPKLKRSRNLRTVAHPGHTQHAHTHKPTHLLYYKLVRHWYVFGVACEEIIS